jgi:hypothetical protein
MIVTSRLTGKRLKQLQKTRVRVQLIYMARKLLQQINNPNFGDLENPSIKLFGMPGEFSFIKPKYAEIKKLFRNRGILFKLEDDVIDIVPMEDNHEES